MQDRICVVTGATRGIGRQTALALASQGATVALVGRNPERGRQTLEELSRSAANPHRLRYFNADFAELAQVRRLAEMLHDAYERIDVLVNNAGAINARRMLTVDGYELTFAVNHLAPFLLTGLIIDLVLKGAPARIVNVSSGAHLRGRIDFDDVMAEKHYSQFGAYAQSKLANILFTTELAERLEGRGVVVNAVHPGAVQSGFAQNNGDIFQFVVWLGGPLLLSPAQGADTVIWAATAPEMAGVTGQYVYKRKPGRLSAAARERGGAGRLWDLSEKLTGAPFAARGL